jgi:N-acyl-phosphatidylethanolamine-hydrolysing phospholipase D
LLKRYSNPYQKKIRRGLIHFILWQLGFYKDPYSFLSAPPGFKFPNGTGNVDYSKPVVTWINHSTFWIQIDRKSFLVDPIWNERCSPLPFMGPKRAHPPPLSLEGIASLDFIILSHNHYDHLDKYTLESLCKRHPHVEWIVPKGVKKWLVHHLPSLLSNKVKELDWWNTFESEGFWFTAVPAQHFSGRGFFDRNRSLWMGCAVESTKSGKRFYFAGDTGYNPYDFKEIGKKLGSFDLSLLPIGAYTPRPFMQAVHVNPDESVLIHQEVRSKLSIGGHWGTFHLANEPLDRPPYDLFCALQRRGVSPKQFRVINPGQTINW